MRQADLPKQAVATLGAEHVRHPDCRLGVAEHAGHHSAAAAGPDHVQHRQRGDEHPFPPVAAAHPGRRLVAAHHGGSGHRRLDRALCGQQRFGRALQHVADRTFADAQAENLAQQRCQPFEADGVGVMQVDHQRADRLAKRRARFQARRCFSRNTLAAAGALAAEQPHPGDIGLDRRDLDAVIDFLRGLLAGGEAGGTMRTGLQLGVHDAVGIGLQHPAHAGTAAAVRLAGIGAVGFLALGRGHGGVVRRPLRPLVSGQTLLELGDAHERDFQPARQRQQRPDQVVLLDVAQLA